MFKVFTRTWWKIEADGSRTPEAGRKRTLATVPTEAEAQRLCQAWNATHSPGKRSRKAEYTEA